MAASQQITWTPIPNGSQGGLVNVSVHIGPRLTPSSTPGLLSQFPNWLDWPTSIASLAWTLRIANAAGQFAFVNATRITTATTSESLLLWQALFNASTLVNSFNYQSPSGDSLYSYPASYVRQDVVGIHTQVASQSPTGWPDGASLLAGALSSLPQTDTQEQSAMATLLSDLPAPGVKQGGPIPQRASPDASLDLVQVKLFLQALTASASAPAPTPPVIDFHQAVSMVGRHPALARALGLIIDLQIPSPALAAPTTIQLIPKYASATAISPIVNIDSSTWLAVPRPTNPNLAEGQLDMSGPDYELVEADLDGAALKLLAFSKTVYRSLNDYAFSRHANQLRAPVASLGWSLPRSIGKSRGTARRPTAL